MDIEPLDGIFSPGKGESKRRREKLLPIRFAVGEIPRLRANEKSLDDDRGGSFPRVWVQRREDGHRALGAR